MHEVRLCIHIDFASIKFGWINLLKRLVFLSKFSKMKSKCFNLFLLEIILCMLSALGDQHTCRNSRYGCCPDGVTSAQGNNNEGCPNACQVSPLFVCKSKSCQIGHLCVHNGKSCQMGH